MKKKYIFDTNVLIHDPNSIFKFQENDIYIPIYVLEELDKLKSDHGERGFSVREAVRRLDELRTSGKLFEGVALSEDENPGKLYVYCLPDKANLLSGLTNIVDNYILQSALSIKEEHKEEDTRTILVTMDINMRVRAEALGLQVASYESQSVDPNRMISGQTSVSLDHGSIDKMYSDELFKPDEIELYDNQFVTIDENSRSALGRYNKNLNKIEKLKVPREGVMGIRPRNKEQQFALDLLLDKEVSLVTLVGLAGSGKTLLSLSVGLKSVLDGEYDKLIISRPIMPMGKDLGFLPGDISEKLDPYMKPFYDNLDFIMMSGRGRNKVNINDLIEDGVIQIEPITYIRGRSFPNSFIICDECQNISPLEVKTIITRCGEGSKIILTGDPDQIDNPYIDKASSGLSVVVEKLNDKSMVGHLKLTKGERSALANIAAEYL